LIIKYDNPLYFLLIIAEKNYVILPDDTNAKAKTVTNKLPLSALAACMLI